MQCKTVVNSLTQTLGALETKNTSEQQWLMSVFRLEWFRTRLPDFSFRLSALIWLACLILLATSLPGRAQNGDGDFDPSYRSNSSVDPQARNSAAQYCSPDDPVDTSFCMPPDEPRVDYWNENSRGNQRLNTDALDPDNFPPESYSPNPRPLGNRGKSPTATSPRVEREPLSEYQRYVSATTGQVLPIFGASLFERVPNTFAPVDHVAVSPTYLIAPGDELQITVWGQVNFSRRMLVGNSGQVILPDTGPLTVAGLTYSQVAAVLKSAMMHVYKNFDVSVTFGRLHTIQVFVVGEAHHPGVYTVSSLSTIVNAIFACGGPSAHGSMRHIELRRGADLVRDFDLYKLLIKGDKSNDARLESGDVIVLRPVGPRVAVTGSVERPAIYELTGETSVGELLTLSGGFSPVAGSQLVTLQRITPGGSLSVIKISTDAGSSRTLLKNGDILRILPLVPRFERTVTLRGNVADAVRVPWFTGMRLSDLIPDKEVLLTRDYWKQKNLAADVSIPSWPRNVEPDSLTQDEAGRPVQKAASLGTGTDRLLASLSSSNGLEMPFREQPRNTRGDASLGAATADEDVPPIRKFAPRNSIEPNAPDINWAYASIERVDPKTLNTQVIPFELGRVVLDHDLRADMMLSPGDVVTIFSKADFLVPSVQQTKQIRIEGEVRRAGIYSVVPGETLRDVVTRAGGLTSSAYLYGLQFTRESTRREQQKRYEDFLNQFERQVNEAASNLSTRVTSPQQAATAQTSVASQRDLIERLRQVSMDGRIVLDLQPNSKRVESLPDLPLENGDRLYIPSRPSTVNVIGTVAEQTSFLYEEDLRTQDYLEKAGGPARSADRSHMFIIRADGSVVSENAHIALFAKSFASLPMYPGDTLVVPTFINKSTLIRDLMDWSQVFSNLALGAAAVNVLH